MKLSEIKEPGFYWNRADAHRAWCVVYVRRQMCNPEHPRHNLFEINASGSSVGPTDSLSSPNGDFIGPITAPER